MSEDYSSRLAQKTMIFWNSFSDPQILFLYVRECSKQIFIKIGQRLGVAQTVQRFAYEVLRYYERFYIFCNIFWMVRPRVMNFCVQDLCGKRLTRLTFQQNQLPLMGDLGWWSNLPKNGEWFPNNVGFKS